MTSMTQRYGDHRWKAEALNIMLADVMMDAGCTSSSTLDLKKDEGYMGRLKRSVLSESWAAVDYDSRHHHAYCEVSEHHPYYLPNYALLSTLYCSYTTPHIICN